MLYLASESPRRRELLKKLGFPFVAETAHVTELEQADETCSISLLPQANSKLKAEAVSRRHLDDTVIGADTSIILDDRILGKPRDLPDARRILALLSGRSHEVVTGVTVMRTGERPFLRSWSDVSVVTFKKLSPEIIEDYLRKVNVLDKAGAYAIQEHGDMIISGFTGDLDNIIGLPTLSLAAFLSTSTHLSAYMPPPTSSALFVRNVQSTKKHLSLGEMLFCCVYAAPPYVWLLFPTNVQFENTVPFAVYEYTAPP